MNEQALLPLSGCPLIATSPADEGNDSREPASRACQGRVVTAGNHSLPVRVGVVLVPAPAGVSSSRTARAGRDQPGSVHGQVHAAVDVPTTLSSRRPDTDAPSRLAQ